VLVRSGLPATCAVFRYNARMSAGLKAELLGGPLDGLEVQVGVRDGRTPDVVVLGVMTGRCRRALAYARLCDARYVFDGYARPEEVPSDEGDCDGEA